MGLSSKAFWVDALERAVRTVAQAMLGMLTAGQLSLLTVDWKNLVAVAGLAGIVSLLMSVAASGNSTTASFIK